MLNHVSHWSGSPLQFRCPRLQWAWARQTAGLSSGPRRQRPPWRGLRSRRARNPDTRTASWSRSARSWVWIPFEFHLKALTRLELAILGLCVEILFTRTTYPIGPRLAGPPLLLVNLPWKIDIVRILMISYTNSWYLQVWPGEAWKYWNRPTSTCRIFLCFMIHCSLNGFWNLNLQ